MTRRLGALLSALALAACSPVADIVAYASPSGEPVDPGTVPTSSPSPPSPGPFACTSDPFVVVRTKDGHLGLVAERGTTTRIVPTSPECTIPGAGPVAIAIDGTVWAAVEGKLVVFDTSGACKLPGVALDASAMAFVYDAKQGRDSLYALVGGQLVVVDPYTGLRTPIGRVVAPDVVLGLAGTVDGRLFALVGREKPAIYEVRVGDGSLGASLPVATSSPPDEPLVGLAMSPSATALVTDVAVEWFDPKLSAGGSRVPHRLVGAVSAGGAPCAVFAF